MAHWNLKDINYFFDNYQSDTFFSSVRNKSTKAHLLWVKGSLSKLETLSILSFIKHGYIVNLWTYNSHLKPPKGAVLRDARAIFPESQIFTYENGSFAAFSNLFRYAVLMKEGGLWADTDVVCLLPSMLLENSNLEEFYVTERTENNDIQLNCNVIYLRNPKKGCLTDLALQIAKTYPIEELFWGACGPKLLTALAKLYPNLVPALMEPSFANPVDWFVCPNALLEPIDSIPREWGFLHCYNEMWRSSGKDKNAPYPVESILQRIESFIFNE